VLCWTLFVQAGMPGRIGPVALLRLIAACVAVATINATRIALLVAMARRHLGAQIRVPAVYAVAAEPGCRLDAMPWAGLA
jgi:hypothetical protein